MQPTPWIIRQPPNEQRNLHLYCFSYAGGNAISYLPWQQAMDGHVEIRAVQLPGRGARLGEQPCTSLALLVSTLAQLIARQGDTPFAFFGHSLGGVLAFEITRYCVRQGLPLPEQLIVSGSAAPRHRGPSRNLHLLPDGELIQLLRDYNGTPRNVLESQELMALVLPTIRADFALVENYQYQPGPILDLPITVFAGREDGISAEQILGWQEETSDRFRAEWFDGDHFFVNSNTQQVLKSLNSQLSAFAQADSA